jgi:anti-anti-sigma regulatory factor
VSDRRDIDYFVEKEKTHMDIQQAFTHGVVIITLVGSVLSDDDAVKLTRVASSYLNSGFMNIVMRLDQVKYINDVGMTGLLDAKKLLEDAGADVSLIGMRQNIEAILKRTVHTNSPSVFHRMQQAKSNHLRG